MSTSKPFLSYEQQINKLINDKDLVISDKEHAIKLLKDHSYFSLICGYKHPFKYRNTSKYKKGVTIDDIFSLYVFDENLRYILLKYIFIVEKRIKSLLAYAFTEEFGEDQTHYLDAAKYNYLNKKNDVEKLIELLKKLITPPFDYNYLYHQSVKHHNIPLWVLVKALTFGNISKMYSVSLPQIQCKVSKEFTGIREGDLISMLDVITRFRNVCAHNERAYNYYYKKGSIKDTPFHSAFFELENGAYKQGKSDFFAVIIALKYLVDPSLFIDMINQINHEVEILLQSTNQIQRPQLYKYMGFPNNWLAIRDMLVS